MQFLEIVGVTLTELTYFVGFGFLTSENEDNFTWVLQNLLKCKKIMSKVIVTHRDTTPMNVVANIFPTSSALVCRCHISKNVRVKCKLHCKVKGVKGKEVKTMDLCNTLVDV